MKTLTAVILLILLGFAARGEDETPAELVVRLGDSEFEVRKKAYSDLLGLGYFAREDVRNAMSSKDPETKERARELWKTLRWMSFPKAGKEIAQSISKLENKPADKEVWDKLYAAYGADMIYLLVEMHSDAKYADHSVRGFSILLEKTDPAELATVISSCRDKEKKKMMLEYLASSRPENLNSELCSKMLKVLKQLKLYEEALVFGEDACKTWKRDSLLFETAKVVKEGHLEKLLWEDCAREIMDEGDAGSRESMSWFYITMSAIMSEPERIRAIIDAFDGKFQDVSVLRKICVVLAKIKMHDELLRITESRQEPLFSYMRSFALEGLGKKDDSEKLWNTVSAGLKSEEDCYSMAELMDEIGDARAEQIWARILEIGADGKETVYDVNAYLKLAPYCEKRGENEKAADYYEKAIAGSKDLGAFMLITSDSGKSLGSADAEKYLKEKIDELRKKK